MLAHEGLVESAELEAILRRHARETAAAPALLAAGAAPLTYAALVRQIEHVRLVLGAWGVRRGDRVALLLADGPVYASALISVFCCVDAVPLNARLTAPEVRELVAAMGARAIVAVPGADALREPLGVAGVRVIELIPAPDAAGAFTLALPPAPFLAPGGALGGPELGDAAITLHTSGTTATPKRVALSHARVAAIAASFAAAFELSPRDRCVGVMPLMHTHGIFTALAALVAGGSVACLPATDPQTVLDALVEIEPTWYSAVPAVHQALLAAVARSPERIAELRLRFVRSSASPLAASVLEALEATFAAPVIETYGLTECSFVALSTAAHRKAGSVGIPSDRVRLRVLDAAGVELPPATPGEIVIEGPDVVEGYDGDDAAACEAVRCGGLRTGDLGYVDSDGAIFLIGRRTEIIDKGGEKIAPVEIDAALLRHPDVVEAVAFPVPHPILGHNLAAAVVLRAGATGDERDLQRFAARTLAPYKLPYRIFIEPAIPKGPTGKYRRSGLYDALNVAARSSASYVAPRDPLERQLVLAWEEVLGAVPLSVDDNVFERGATSLDAARVLARIASATGVSLPVSTLLFDATVARLAATIRARGVAAAPCAPAQILAVDRSGDGPPLFFHHEDPLHHGVYCRAIATALAGRNPFYTIAPHGLDGGPIPPTIDAIADDLIAQIRRHAPVGPVALGGFCAGGVVALEVARRLRACGREVRLVVMLHVAAKNARVAPLARLLPDGSLRARALGSWHALRERAFRLRRYGIRAALQAEGEQFGPDLDPSKRAALASWLGHRRANAGYLPRTYDGRVLFFAAEGEAHGDPTLGWSRYLRAAEYRSVPGSRSDLVSVHIDAIAAVIGARLSDT